MRRRGPIPIKEGYLSYTSAFHWRLTTKRSAWAEQHKNETWLGCFAY
jgi:hypothetical protein